jgi:membrane protein DedA with SNARE-associated domain
MIWSSEGRRPEDTADDDAVPSGRGPAIGGILRGGRSLVPLQRVRVRRCLGAVALAGLAGGVVAVLLGGVDLPEGQDEMAEAFDSPGRWTYVLAGTLALLEVGTPVGLAAPTELALPVAGAAAANGTVALGPLIGLVWLCAAVGQSCGFATGRLLGRRAIDRLAARLRIPPERVARFDRHFARHGTWTILVAGFGPYVRTLTPFLAGSSRMSYARFLPTSVVASAIWSCVLVLLGYAFADQLTDLGGWTLVLGAVVAAVVLMAAVMARWRRRTGVPLVSDAS